MDWQRLTLCPLTASLWREQTAVLLGWEWLPGNQGSRSSTLALQGLSVMSPRSWGSAEAGKPLPLGTKILRSRLPHKARLTWCRDLAFLCQLLGADSRTLPTVRAVPMPSFPRLPAGTWCSPPGPSPAQHAWQTAHPRGHLEEPSASHPLLEEGWPGPRRGPGHTTHLATSRGEAAPPSLHTALQQQGGIRLEAQFMKL